MVKSRFALAPTVLVVGLLLVPAAQAASAPTGGTSPSGGPSGGASPGGPGSPATSAPAPGVVLDPPVIVTGGAVVVRMPSSALLGRILIFRGRTRTSSAGQTVLIQRYDTPSARWLGATSARVGRTGSFLARWRTSLLGHVSLRAVIGAASIASRHRIRPVSSTTAQVTVYSPARATYFGPGFYGKTTACGETMSNTLVGVASRTLPCGTLVDINYNNRDITVPVVDRGPYANGADWDLTSAAAQAIGMTGTVTIGTIVTGQTAPASPSESSPPQSSTTGGAPAG